MEVRVRYIDEALPALEHIGGRGKSNWIDLRASRVIVTTPNHLRSSSLNDLKGKAEWGNNGSICYKRGDVVVIFAGFAMQIPLGFEAIVAPRSSTFKNYGLAQVNSIGVIDTAYCGDNDEWFIMFYAHTSGDIHRYDRVAQFRLYQSMPHIQIMSVDCLGKQDRGGGGSSGVK